MATKFAIYDFDGTLLLKQSVPFILRQWKALQLPSRAYSSMYRTMLFKYAVYKIGIFGYRKETFHRDSMSLLATLFATVTIEQLGLFFDALAKVSQPFLNKKILRAIEKDKKAGYQLVLLSGNYDVFLERYRQLGFDHILGSGLFNEQARVHKQPTILIGEEKNKALEKRIPNFNWQHTKAYADSYYDLVLLRKVKEAIAVNPDHKLAQYAKKAKWTILTSTKR
jgi:phosphoserine phosphatase